MENNLLTKHNTFVLHKGFTLIEILVVLTIVGLVIIPFTNMFLFGYKGSVDNIQYVIAYNLAREKIEMIRALPFHAVQSDYSNFRDVFRDRPGYDNAFYNESSFKNYFTDVFTNVCISSDNEARDSYQTLKTLHQDAYLIDLKIYPDEFSGFRRVATVQDVSQSITQVNLKKVIVEVYSPENNKLAELTTMVGDHK